MLAHVKVKVKFGGRSRVETLHYKRCRSPTYSLFCYIHVSQVPVRSTPWLNSLNAYTLQKSSLASISYSFRVVTTSMRHCTCSSLYDHLACLCMQVSGIIPAHVSTVWPIVRDWGAQTQWATAVYDAEDVRAMLLVRPVTQLTVRMQPWMALVHSTHSRKK